MGSRTTSADITPVETKAAGETEVRRLLGPEGPFAARPRYEHREEQLAMGEAVARALGDASVLLCEAGTGVGKTLAYLVPALLSEQRVVVSTATKTLQDQIVSRDIPSIAEALGIEPRVAVAKGLANYVCLRKLSETRASASPPRALPLVESWVKETRVGDRAELSTLAEDDPVWSDIVSSSDSRIGYGCDHFDSCFATRMRQELARARLVVVNHHLFFADLALKAKAGPAGEARASVLPPYDAVVFDEAHRIEEIMSTFFGVRISTGMFKTLARDAERTFAAALDDASARSGGAILREVLRVSQSFFGTLAKRTTSGASDGRVRLGRDALDPTDHAAHRALDDALETLEGFAETHAVTESMEALRRRARALRDDAAAVVDPATHHVAWIESKGANDVSMGASITDVGPLFRDRVAARLGGVVLTSATLTTVPLKGPTAEREVSGFSFLRRRLGLDEMVPAPVEELELGSPFDFAERSILYVPRDLPNVAAPDFLERAARRAAELVEITGGGAFVLTTTAKAMRVLGPAIAATGREVMVQGDAPKSALIDRFRSHGHAVLVATMSYWEGVDVPGEALRLVIIDKLPFAVPTDALVAAKCSALEREGVDPFYGYTVPEAAITLKQGLGRLLRTASDRGVAAVFDNRLVSRAYGHDILARLPPMPRTEHIEDVRAFWARWGAETRER